MGEILNRRYKAGAEAIYIPDDVFTVPDEAPEMAQALILNMQEAMHHTAVRAVDAADAAVDMPSAVDAVAKVLKPWLHVDDMGNVGDIVIEATKAAVWTALGRGDGD